SRVRASSSSRLAQLITAMAASARFMLTGAASILGRSARTDSCIKANVTDAMQSVFEDDHGHGSVSGMGERECDVPGAESARKFCRASRKLQDWPPAWSVADFKVLPCDSTAQAGANGLHRCFFGGKASGITLRRILLGFAIPDLCFGENSIQKSAPEAFNRLANAIYFGDVDTAAHDHVRWFTENPIIASKGGLTIPCR